MHYHGREESILYLNIMPNAVKQNLSPFLLLANLRLTLLLCKVPKGTSLAWPIFLIILLLDIFKKDLRGNQIFLTIRESSGKDIPLFTVMKVITVMANGITKLTYPTCIYHSCFIHSHWLLTSHKNLIIIIIIVVVIVIVIIIIIPIIYLFSFINCPILMDSAQSVCGLLNFSNQNSLVQFIFIISRILSDKLFSLPLVLLACSFLF